MEVNLYQHVYDLLSLDFHRADVHRAEEKINIPCLEWHGWNICRPEDQYLTADLNLYVLRWKPKNC